ncbi:FtsQ-type POTRA domain-containing protein [Streptomyces sp. NBC_01474]|uniref:cell division protein FtsQ/DivIB n=1 Tax=unclassified Streptomyces TaxID=2593676 RepID=UPI002DD87409|nr:MULTISPECIES: FtsQ-type POTRA domain-containing protein [unclassified Streptomyces]WSD98748.1 FtsQ-type POTRA domain-containing protein [Streptomyces sp. NBC_01474]
MAGPTTADRGERHKPKSGPPRPPRGGRPRLPRPRVLIVTGVALLLGAATIWILYGSQWLRVERVTTSGTGVLTPAQVRAAAAVPVGAPLISVDTGDIEDRLRRKLPRIDSVEVVRSWPHGIGLKVTEREPVLIVENGANGKNGENREGGSNVGKFVEIDAKGVRFATVQKAPRGVPRLELTPDQAGAAASLRRFGPDSLVREAVRVAGDLPPAVARDTRAVKVRSYDDVSLELSGGRTVAWGSGEKGDTKATTLTALMKAAPKARHFDVSVPTAPASSGS